MIYNRTYADIINARKIYFNKLQKFLPLTTEEQDIINRAFFNLVAINRITEKISQIWEVIKSEGGEKVEKSDVREWTEQEWFTVSNFVNIRENISDIITQMSILPYIDVPSYEGMYEILNDEYVYTNLNNIEKLLFDIYEILTKFAVQVKNELYIVGAYNSNLDAEGVLTIE